MQAVPVAVAGIVARLPPLPPAHHELLSNINAELNENGTKHPHEMLQPTLLLLPLL